jgi:hypothetical protein
MRKVIVTLGLVVLSGCGAAPMIKSAASFAVSEFCAIPELGRRAVRYEVSEALDPNKIEITCND